MKPKSNRSLVFLFGCSSWCFLRSLVTPLPSISPVLSDCSLKSLQPGTYKITHPSFFSATSKNIIQENFLAPGIVYILNTLPGTSKQKRALEGLSIFVCTVISRLSASYKLKLSITTWKNLCRLRVTCHSSLWTQRTWVLGLLTPRQHIVLVLMH